MHFTCVSNVFAWHSKPGARTSQLFIEFVSKSGSDPKNFRGVSVDDLPFVEGINERNIFINNFDIQEGEDVQEIAIRSIGNFEKTAKLSQDSTTISIIRMILILSSIVYDVIALVVS